MYNLVLECYNYDYNKFKSKMSFSKSVTRSSWLSMDFSCFVCVCYLFHLIALICFLVFPLLQKSQNATHVTLFNFNSYLFRWISFQILSFDFNLTFVDSHVNSHTPFLWDEAFSFVIQFEVEEIGWNNQLTTEQIRHIVDLLFLPCNYL